MFSVPKHQVQQTLSDLDRPVSDEQAANAQLTWSGHWKDVNYCQRRQNKRPSVWQKQEHPISMLTVPEMPTPVPRPSINTRKAPCTKASWLDSRGPAPLMKATCTNLIGQVNAVHEASGYIAA